MDERTKFNLLQGLKSGLLNERQSFDALQAIKEDKPTSEVADLMGSLAFSGMNSGESLSQITDKRSGKDREMFDYESGADGKLRALMSFGETEGDREAILSRAVGEDGYVRDPSGKLALTESGQRSRGMEPIGKNLIIEDEGFSMRDFADFTGILPETIGSIGGAIAGGGLTLGFGSIAGAGAGGALGQALEEAIESYLGVQTQNLGEVARDVAIEGAIGAGGEVAGAILAAGGRKLFGAGKSLAGRAANKSMSAMDEVTLKQLDQADRLLSKGSIPSMRSVGAPESLSYMIDAARTAAKDTTVIDNNLRIALQDKKAFTDTIIGDPINDLGKSVMSYAPIKFDKLNKNIKSAHSKTFNAIDTGMKMLYKSVDEGVDLNAKTLTRIVDSFNTFDEVSRASYGAIDNLLSKISEPVKIDGKQVMKEGGSLKIFDTRVLMSKFDDMIEEHSTALLEGPIGLAHKALVDFSANGESRASFRNLVSLRKHVNDSLMFGAGTQGTKQLTSVKGLIDDMLDDQGIPLQMEFTGANIRPENAEILAEAAKIRKIANSEYRKGISKYEKVSRLGVIGEISNLKSFDDTGVREISDKFFSRVIKPDSPERLQGVLDAVDNPEELLDELGGRFFSMALSDSKFNEINPEAFNGKKFATSIMSLGTTGPKLFGKNWGKIKKLSKVMEQTSIKNTLTFDDVQRVIDSGGSKNLVISLENIVKANKDQTEALTTSVIKKLQDPNATASYDDVVRALTKNTLTEGETRQIMKFFDNNSQMKANMKNVVMEDILKQVDEDVFLSPGKAKSLKKQLESYKPGSLKQILNADGTKTYEAIQLFADDLAFLGRDVGTAGAIAAGSMWTRVLTNPLNVIGRVARFKGFAKAFSNPKIVKSYIDMRRSTINNPEARGQGVINIMNQAAIDGGMDIGSTASKASNALRKASSISGQASRVNKNVVPRALFRQEQENRTNIPEVQQPQIPEISIPKTAQPKVSATPTGIIDVLRSNVNQELRDRARQNPAAAATLLGGLGNADLL